MIETNRNLTPKLSQEVIRKHLDVFPELPQIQFERTESVTAYYRTEQQL